MDNIVILAEIDSNLRKEIVERYRIAVAPIHVTLGDVTMDDRTFPVEAIWLRW